MDHPLVNKVTFIHNYRLPKKRKRVHSLTIYSRPRVPCLLYFDAYIHTYIVVYIQSIKRTILHRGKSRSFIVTGCINSYSLRLCIELSVSRHPLLAVFSLVDRKFIQQASSYLWMFGSMPIISKAIHVWATPKVKAIAELSGIGRNGSPQEDQGGGSHGQGGDGLVAPGNLRLRVMEVDGADRPKAGQRQGDQEGMETVGLPCEDDSRDRGPVDDIHRETHDQHLDSAAGDE